MKKFAGLAVMLLGLLVFNSSCRKEGNSRLNCNELKAGLLANDEARVGRSIAGLLGSYSEQAINQLAAALSGPCSLTTTVDCFECIKTLPAQTEVRISFLHNGSLVKKTLDFSSSPDKKLMLAGLHD